MGGSGPYVEGLVQQTGDNYTVPLSRPLVEGQEVTISFRSIEGHATVNTLFHRRVPACPPGQKPAVASPVIAQNGVAANVSGTVRIRRWAESKGFITLKPGETVPFDATIDATKGRLTLTAVMPGGKTQSAAFSGAVFVPTQKQSSGLVTLTLADAVRCTNASPRSSVTGAPEQARPQLWGDGKGKFRTRGTYGAATGRGTRWLTTNTCTSTTFRVANGTVMVSDRIKNRTVIVKTGSSYTARRR